jgi:mono/diheme cytochrome c family protein
MMLTQVISLLVFLVGSATTALAVEASVGYPTNDTERLGQRLFNQSCRVCHGSNVEGTLPGAPALTKNTLGGDAAAIQTLIGDGTASAGSTGRMPAWKYRFSPTEIQAIATYIKTIPIGPATQ